jgi:hypothetical protein
MEYKNGELLIQDVFTPTVDEHRTCVEDCQGCIHILIERARRREQSAC